MTRRDVAVVVSALLNPGAVLGAFVAGLAVAGAEVRRCDTVMVAVVFTTAIPMATVVALRWRGAVSDLDLRVRAERQAVYAACGVSYACGAALLFALGARWAAGALVAALATAVVALAINRRVKVSIHAMAITGVSIASLLFAGRAAWPVTLAVPVAAWARWAAGAHTAAELAGGTLLGGAVAFFGFGAMVALFGP